MEKGKRAKIISDKLDHLMDNFTSRKGERKDQKKKSGLKSFKTYLINLWIISHPEKVGGGTRKWTKLFYQQYPIRDGKQKNKNRLKSFKAKSDCFI